jgi:hypothetical protein
MKVMLQFIFEVRCFYRKCFSSNHSFLLVSFSDDMFNPIALQYQHYPVVLMQILLPFEKMIGFITHYKY